MVKAAHACTCVDFTAQAVVCRQITYPVGTPGLWRGVLLLLRCLPLACLLNEQTNILWKQR
jgi:hypothetical protein